MEHLLQIYYRFTTSLLQVYYRFTQLTKHLLVGASKILILLIIFKSIMSVLRKIEIKSKSMLNLVERHWNFYSRMLLVSYNRTPALSMRTVFISTTCKKRQRGEGFGTSPVSYCISKKIKLYSCNTTRTRTYIQLQRPWNFLFLLSRLLLLRVPCFLPLLLLEQESSRRKTVLQAVMAIVLVAVLR